MWGGGEGVEGRGWALSIQLNSESKFYIRKNDEYKKPVKITKNN